jgi:C4-type Zn-finger protein
MSGSVGWHPVEWHCPRCGSTRWVAASLTGPVSYGGKAIRQCVPCGYYSGDPVPAREHRPGVRNVPTVDVSHLARDTQGAICPTCGRYVRLLIDGQYEAHTIPGVYDRGCHQGGR